MSDPKLKAARAEITELCKRLDIACHVVLHNAPGDSELFFCIEPSYSKVRIDIKEGLDGKGAVAMRMLSKAEHYGGDKVAQLRDQAATANMLRSFGEMLENHGSLFLYAAAHVDTIVGAEHTELEKTEPPEGQKRH